MERGEHEHLGGFAFRSVVVALVKHHSVLKRPQILSPITCHRASCKAGRTSDDATTREREPITGEDDFELASQNCLLSSVNGQRRRCNKLFLALISP